MLLEKDSVHKKGVRFTDSNAKGLTLIIVLYPEDATRKETQAWVQLTRKETQAPILVGCYSKKDSVHKKGVRFTDSIAKGLTFIVVLYPEDATLKETQAWVQLTRKETQAPILVGCYSKKDSVHKKGVRFTDSIAKGLTFIIVLRPEDATRKKTQAWVQLTRIQTQALVLV